MEGNAAIDGGKDTATINIAHENHIGLSVLRHGEIHEIGIPEIDFRDAPRSFEHNGIIVSRQTIERLTHLLTEVYMLQGFGSFIPTPIIIGITRTDRLAVEHHLRRMVTLGFQQQGIHIRMTGNACCLCLNCLSPADLQSLRRGVRVQRHVLGLEGGWMIAILQEDATEGCGKDTLANIAAGSGKHHGMEFFHKSRPGLSCAASSKVRIALQSVAARLEPPLRPSTMIFGISRKGFTMCFDSRTWTKPTGAAMIPAG